MDPTGEQARRFDAVLDPTTGSHGPLPLRGNEARVEALRRFDRFQRQQPNRTLPAELETTFSAERRAASASTVSAPNLAVGGSAREQPTLLAATQPLPESLRADQQQQQRQVAGHQQRVPPQVGERAESESEQLAVDALSLARNRPRRRARSATSAPRRRTRRRTSSTSFPTRPRSSRSWRARASRRPAGPTSTSRARSS